MTMDPVKCQDMYNLIMTTGYRGGQLLHFAASFICITSTIVLIVKYRSRQLHPNLQPLIGLLLMFAVAHSICESSFQIHNWIYWYTAVEPCEAMFYSSFCVKFHAIMKGCDIGLVYTMFFISIERIVATRQAGEYEKYGGKLGVIFSTTVLIVTSITIIIVYTPIDLFEYYPSCGMTPDSIANRLSVLVWVLAALEMFNIVVFVVLFYTNRMMRKRVHVKIIFKLSNQYQIRENINFIQVMLPLTIVHSVIFMFYLTTQPILINFKSYFNSFSLYTYRLVLMYHYIIPYYTAILPLVLIWNIRTALKKAQGSTPSRSFESYFKDLQEQWN